ncbi:hypothetical protein ACFOLF_14830 [Paenibacillus sepulcri]|uniref:Uncharacterized protein n=1 Tax=Paenibacillus sepulcri TaxID=359917 RepID=A0ABS7BVT0_9BACL|nr:hypothetical protein [Paenibacillus sepulcri]
MIQPHTFAADSTTSKIFEGKRSPEFKDNQDWLNIQSSEGGTRFITKDGSKEIMLMDNYGGTYINGDLFLNNEKINDKLNNTVSSGVFQTAFIVIIVLMGFLLLALLFIYFKMKKQVKLLEKQLKYSQN